MSNFMKKLHKVLFYNTYKTSEKLLEARTAIQFHISLFSLVPQKIFPENYRTIHFLRRFQNLYNATESSLKIFRPLYFLRRFLEWFSNTVLKLFTKGVLNLLAATQSSRSYSLPWQILLLITSCTEFLKQFQNLLLSQKIPSTSNIPPRF